MLTILALMLLQQIGMTTRLPVGSILIATEKSHDPDLAQSVILLIHSDRDGVMGLILNRPRGKLLYFGGPIALGVRALVQAHAKPASNDSEGTQRILNGAVGVYMVSKESSIPKDAMAREYAGYAGWSVQQLTDEISRGFWKVVPGAAATIFDPHPETLWQRMAR